MNTGNLEKIIALRRKLHTCPERSGHETHTMSVIANFLRENTSLQVEPQNGWLLATHFENESFPCIGFRADMDAIPDGVNGARHGCGHDGHSAILCGLGLELEGKRTGNNIYLIFQPAEETGKGAQSICNDWLDLKKLTRIYGLHNIPGHPKGTLLLRNDCFACASSGLIVKIIGRPAHAAYPEDGANPAELISLLALETPKMIKNIINDSPRLLMRTIIGIQVGGENFGLSASEGQLCLTLRAHRHTDIEALLHQIKDFVSKECTAHGMICSFELRDVFPDTTNDPAVVSEAVSVWQAAGIPMKKLSEPMRWSEDFGWYLKNTSGMFFGIGVGENAVGLHTAEYEFNDDVINAAVTAFYKLI